MGHKLATERLVLSQAVVRAGAVMCLDMISTNENFVIYLGCIKYKTNDFFLAI